jgi:phospholipase/carboxylesterase
VSASFAPTPVVATVGSPDLNAPLVVLLHGRGSNEREILELAAHLPDGLAYAAVRAPIEEGGGYAWFANRGIGRPVAESLRENMDWFTTWLDSAAAPGRPVVLVGFSGGAAFAGGLVLDHPSRYAGAAILYGTLPFDAGVPVTPGRLAGLPVLVAQGEQDTVIPRELLDATWHYLTNASGAPAWASRHPGGHGISASSLAELGGWLGERVSYLTGHGRGSTLVAPWAGLPGGHLPERQGSRPEVSTNTPQEQITQQSPHALQEQLFTRLSQLPGVSSHQSVISVPGARGFMLSGAAGPPDAFLVAQVGEFAHLHPSHDGSLHVALPPRMAADVIAKGWGVAHPLAGLRVTPGMVMLFGPRDEDELDVVAAVVTVSHAWASRGTITPLAIARP